MKDRMRDVKHYDPIKPFKDIQQIQKLAMAARTIKAGTRKIEDKLGIIEDHLKAIIRICNKE